MSKLLIAGDWHGNHVCAKAIIDVAKAEEIDKIIQVGDFGVWPGAEGAEYLKILSRYLVKRDINLYFVPGNHEDYNQIDEWTRTLPKNEDGHIEIEPNLFYAGKVNAWTWEGKRFASVGGAVSIDKKWRKLNESWWKQETLSSQEELDAQALGKVDFLFTHDCPHIHPFHGLKEDVESEIHRFSMTKIGRALQPELWFHGHMHWYAEYLFEHQKGLTRVYGLDADSKASKYPTLPRHAAVLDTDTEDVYSIDKHFNWWSRAFYFDRQHENNQCAVCNKFDD